MSRPNLRLLEKEAGGDPSLESDQALFQRYAPYVARIGLRLLGRESDVDDLIQEVFLAAFRQRHQVRDPASFKGWLAVVAVRTARRQLRLRSPLLHHDGCRWLLPGTPGAHCFLPDSATA